MEGQPDNSDQGAWSDRNGNMMAVLEERTGERETVWFQSQSIAAFSLPNDVLPFTKEKKTYKMEHVFAGFPTKEKQSQKIK